MTKVTLTLTMVINGNVIINLKKVITKLKADPSTRQACISIYDGKEHT